jgi:hypothetical protein
MGVRYLPIDGEIVSAEWKVALDDMRADGVAFNVNEGKRTFERQWELVRQLGVWSSSNPTGAALPSHQAPHIRTGRFDHAIDFSNDPAVFAWLTGKDLSPARTVPGESWHIEIPANRLAAYAREHGVKPSPTRFLGKVRRVAADTLLHRRRMRKAARLSGRKSDERRWDRLAGRSYRRVKQLSKGARGRAARVFKRVLRDRDGRLK